MKDALQKRLAMIEKESPSPSLQSPENQKQTLKEKMYFTARALLGPLTVRKTRPSQRELQEAATRKSQEENRTYEGAKPELIHQKPLLQSQKDKLFAWQFRRDQQQREAERITNHIRNAKTGVWKDTSGHETKRPVGHLFAYLRDVNTKLQENTSAPEKKYMVDVLDEIDSLFAKAGMPSARAVYESFLERKGTAGAQTALNDLEEYVTLNKISVTEDGINRRINRASSWLHLAGKEFSDRKKLVEEMKEKYAKEARTIPVSEAAKQHGIWIVHGVPYYKDMQGKYPQFWNNAHWREQEQSCNENPGDLNLEDFLENILTHKPDASTSAIRKNSEPKEFFSPYGVLIREGKIYDACTSDLASQGESQKHLVRLANIEYFQEFHDLSERVREVATVPPQTHNEVIIGDNYEIGGLYFVENHHGWGILSRQLEEHPRFQTHEALAYEPKVVARLAKKAVEKALPFYRFRQGEGFVAVDPAAYLAKPATKPSKPARKKRVFV